MNPRKLEPNRQCSGNGIGAVMNKEKLEQMAEEYVQKKYPLTSVSDFEKTMVLQTVGSSAFMEGAQSILNLPEVKAMVKSGREYLKLSPTDGWHFSDCDSHEDNYEDEMPCSCGVSAKEMAFLKALADLEGLLK